MKDRLIVGFDGSAASRSALAWAGDEAQLRSAAVRAVSSFALPPVMDYYGLGVAAAAPAQTKALRDACTAALAEAVTDQVRRHPALGFDYRAEPTSAVEVLVAESADADLVVLGSNGAGPTRSFLLGSVAQEVLHLANCPVVVVPETVRAPVGRVVVGVDGSPSSEQALSWAIDEADRRDAELIVVHAWQYPYELTSERFDRGRDIARVDAATLLEREVAVAGQRRAAPVSERLVEGAATQVLLDASDIGDLLVLGTRGRGGFRAMLLGSVAQSVAAHATCPVVIVR